MKILIIVLVIILSSCAVNNEVNTNGISVVKITPLPGTETNEDTVFNVELQYHVDDFQPEKYHISAQFKTTAGKSTMDPVMSKRGNYLKEKTGVVNLTFTGKQATRFKEIADPLEFQFYLNKKTGINRGTPIFISPLIKYN
jgi:hypothetical protein